MKKNYYFIDENKGVLDQNPEKTVGLTDLN